MISTHRHPAIAAAALAIALTAAAGHGQELDVDPQQFYESAIAGNPHWGNEHTGEQFCWHARVPAGSFVQGYLVTGDEAWLDQAVRYFDTLAERMDEGPDGYKGFIGPYIYDGSVWGDVHVGDAILFDPMLRFSELVLVDRPELRERYGEPAERYVELARVHLFEKWESRGTYYENGPFGGYFQWDHFLREADLSEWVHMPERQGARLSLPFNKNMDMAVVALRVHRVTGESWYRERAEKIFGYFKSRLQRHEGTYLWNYWEPIGQWDLDAEQRGGMRHWVQVHPNRNYQAGEVGKIALAYHHGVVFTAEDMRGILRTNLGVMWNGDEYEPGFANSNLIADPGQTRLREGGAGTLWTGLSDFSETVRRLERVRRGEPGHPRPQISQAYTEQVSYGRPASLERRYADDDVQIPEVYAFPLGDVAAVRMAVVLPSEFEAGETAVILSKLNRDSELRIDVYDAAGEAVVATLFEGDVEGGTDGRDGVHRLDFEGAGLEPGAYRVRWSVEGDGYREYPIVIR